MSHLFSAFLLPLRYFLFCESIWKELLSFRPHHLDLGVLRDWQASQGSLSQEKVQSLSLSVLKSFASPAGSWGLRLSPWWSGAGCFHVHMPLWRLVRELSISWNISLKTGQVETVSLPCENMGSAGREALCLCTCPGSHITYTDVYKTIIKDVIAGSQNELCKPALPEAKTGSAFLFGVRRISEP